MPSPAVPIRTAEGTYGFVDPSQLDQALTAGGEVVPATEVQQAAAQKKYGGLAGTLTSAGLGAARGLSFGTSDVAARSIAEALGGESARQSTARYLREHEEANPIASQVGEYGSMAIPALGELGLAGKAGRIAEVLGAPTRAVMGAGRAAEGLVGNLVGREAEGLGARTLQKGLASAAGAAVEGSAYAAGGELSDEAIQDHDASMEKVLAATGKGMFLGGILGGGMGAAGELGRSALSGLGDSVIKAAKGTSVADEIEKMAGGSVWHGIGGGGNSKITKDVERNYRGGYHELGKDLNDAANELVGENLSHANRDEVAEKLFKKNGPIVGDALKTLDESAARIGEQPRAIDFVNDLRVEAQKYESKLGQRPVADGINKLADHLAEITGIAPGATNYAEAANKRISFKELHEFKQQLGELARYRNETVPTLQNAYRDLTSSFQRKIKTSMDEIAAKTGEQSVRDAYEKANKGMQMAYYLRDIAKKVTGQKGGNLAVTLTEKLMGAAAGGIGAVVGGPIGALAGGALGYAGAHLAREHVPFLAAEGLRRLSKLAAVEKMSMQIDQKIAKSVGTFIRGERGAYVADRFREDPNHYAHQAQEITAIANNPPLMMRHIERGIGNLGPQSPRLTAALAKNAAIGYQFLASKAPKAIMPMTSLTKQLEKPHVSRAAAIKFGKYVRGVRSPLSLLDDLNDGHLSHETVEAVRATSPQLYSQIRTAVIEDCAKLGSKLPYAKRLQLGILFDAPTDETLKPSVIALLQQGAPVESSPPMGETAPAGKPGSRPIKSDSSVYQTDAQRVEGS